VTDTQHTTPGTNNEVGTGLGLMLCRDIVEQNGGQIWIESKPEQGTTVTFTVPANEGRLLSESQEADGIAASDA
jgi:signal transduction histidine kinase